MRRFTTVVICAAFLFAACSSEDEAFIEVASFPELQQGDVIALRADFDNIEYIDRRNGTIVSVNSPTTDDSSPTSSIVARVEVSTDGEQRGLLGHAVIDGRRYAAWTDPSTLDLLVGEVTSGSVDRVVWNGTATRSKAVGGQLDVLDGQLLLGLGSLTEWGRDHGSGALVTLDPDGASDQEPVVVRDGLNNPFAFTVAPSGNIWIADNAPDGSDLPVADRDPEVLWHLERDLADGTFTVAVQFEMALPQRAPSAIVELPDGRVGVCGFLDNEMRAYGPVAFDDDVPVGNDGKPSVTTFDRAGTIGPCQSSAVVLDDGTVAVVTRTDDGAPALRLRQA